MLLAGSTKEDVATPQNISFNNFGTESQREMRFVSLSTVGERLSGPNVKTIKNLKLATPQYLNAYISETIRPINMKFGIQVQFRNRKTLLKDEEIWQHRI